MATVEDTELVVELLDATPEEARRTSRGGSMRGSKWAKLLEAFIASDKPVQKFAAVDSDTAKADGGISFAAATGGLGNAMRTASKNDNPYPVKVSTSKVNGFVYLTRTDGNVATDDEEGDEE